MQIRNSVLIIVSLFITTFLCAQDLESFYRKLEQDVLKFNSLIVIKKVDSLLINSKHNLMLEDLKALKVEALCQINSFSEALLISNEILSSKKGFNERTEVILRIQRALIYEIFKDDDAAIYELNRIEKIYKTRKKDRYYGQYLFRKSSYYRIIKPVKESDSLSLIYATKARDFGELHKYYDVSAISKMLQSFFVRDNNEKRIILLKESLEDFKLLENPRSTAMIYTSLARIYKYRGKLQVAKKHLDSAVIIANKRKDPHLKSYVYAQKSAYLESLNQKDSALFYFKKHFKAEMVLNKEKQNLEIAKINFKNLIEKEKLSTKRTTNELKISKKNNRILLALFLSIILLLSLIIYLYQKLKKSKQRIEYKKEKLELSVKEKELLLKELNHRVKNNLSLIISLIKFQTQEISDSFYVEKFHHLENRIRAIAIAHEQFVYSENRLKGEFYNLEEYLQKISNSLINTSPKEISYKQDIGQIELSIDTALPIGILLNELISNSIEHSITEDELKISLKIVMKNDLILFYYSDSGKIFKTEPKKESLGLFIINSMVNQLEGKIERENSSYKIQLKQK